MDTTKQNILMCEKAVEIQKLWKPIEGDIYTSYKWKELNVARLDYNNDRGDYDDKVKLGGIPPYIWLPRQDQLQRMIIKLYEDNVYRDDYEIRYERELIDWMINSFVAFIHQNRGRPYKNNKTFPDNLISMEQLWLAFVMHELFNKVWNGKDWEKE